MARYDHLDGLRGIAAISVAVFHFLRAFKPDWADSYPLDQTPISTFWNGHFAVYVFFALSGFLFFGKFYGRRPHEGIEACLKRFFRLSLPILPVTVVAFLLHSMGGFPNVDAAALSGSDWLSRWYRFDPDPWLSVFEPMIGMYVAFNAAATYNSNLWTIPYELFAVWMVVGFGVLVRFLPLRLVLALMAVTATFSASGYVLTFLLGAVVWLIIRQEKTAPIAGLLAVISGLTLGRFAPLPGDLFVLQWPIGAALVIYGACVTPKISAVLSTKLALGAGNLSFGVYLIHFLTLNSVAAWVFIQTGSVLITATVYGLTTFALALAFHRLVDIPIMSGLNAAFRRLRYRSAEAQKS